jgi:hypothetical protein
MSEQPETKTSLTTVKPEHFGTGGFFFAAAILEGLVEKGVLTRGDAQEIVKDALHKVRSTDVEEVAASSDLFLHFYGYQTI